MGRLILMYWDCPYCGTKTIGGDHRDCPNCGRPRGKDIKFYHNDAPKVYVPEEKAETISKNADWLCSFCDSLNSDSDAFCKGCGASKEDSEMNYFQMKQLEEIEREEGIVKYEDVEEEEKKEESTYKVTKWDRFVWFLEDHKKPLIIGLASILLVILTIILCMPKAKTLTVNEHTWERTVAIEELKNVDESDWELPEGANLHSSRTELFGYEQVFDHYERQTVAVERYEQVGTETETTYVDLGNGYAEEETYEVPVYDYVTYYEEQDVPIYVDVPIYKTKYYYDIDKWIETRYVETSGSGINPYFGEVNLTGGEREGNKTELYHLICSNKKGESNQYDIDYETWLKLEDGETYHMYLNFGEIVKIKELEEK